MYILCHSRNALFFYPVVFSQAAIKYRIFFIGAIYFKPPYLYCLFRSIQIGVMTLIKWFFRDLQCSSFIHNIVRAETGSQIPCISKTLTHTSMVNLYSSSTLPEQEQMDKVGSIIPASTTPRIKVKHKHDKNCGCLSARKR